MLELNFPRQYPFDYRTVDDKIAIFDSIRRKFVQLTPEEWVRQNLVRYMITDLGFPAGLIAIEKTLNYHGGQIRADVVAHDRQARPLLMAECKAPEVKISRDTFDQVSRYNRVLVADYMVVTNGISHYVFAIDRDAGQSSFLESLPRYEDL